MVVGDLVAVAHGRGAGRRVDREDPAEAEGDADPLGQLVEVVAQDAGSAVGLADGERPVDEVAARRAELDREPLAGQLAQRQRRLERRHAAAGDQDPLAVLPLTVPLNDAVLIDRA